MDVRRGCLVARRSPSSERSKPHARLSHHNPRRENEMKQGIVGLAMGIVLGSVLAAGAAFALNTPGHVVTTSGTAVARVAAASMPVPSNTATRSTDATGAVKGSVSEARHSIETPHEKKAPHAKKKHHAKRHATRRTQSSSASKPAASRDTRRHASDGTNHAPSAVDEGRRGNHDGGSCD